MNISGESGNISLALAQAEAQKQMMKTASEDKKMARTGRAQDFAKHQKLREEAIDATRESASKGLLGAITGGIGMAVGIGLALLICFVFPPASAVVLGICAGAALAGGGIGGQLLGKATFGVEESNLQEQASELELQATKMQKQAEDSHSDAQSQQDLIRQSIETTRTALQNDLKACENVVGRS